MGPLASLDQRDEVRGARSAICRRMPRSWRATPDEVRVSSGDAEKGAFLNPVLLYCDTPFAAEAVHDVEAFGPVSTVMPYDTLDEAVALARRGKGSLVASVFTNDKSGGRGGGDRPGPVPRPGADWQPAVGEDLDRAWLAACRRWCMAAPAAPVAARKWAACGA